MPWGIVVAISHVSMQQGHLDLPESIWKATLEAPDSRFRAAAMLELGTIERRRGNDEAARALYEQALDALGSQPEADFSAVVLQRLAVLNAQRGDPKCAKELLQRAMKAKEASTSERERASALELLAFFQDDCGEHREAIKSLTDALRIRRETFGDDSNPVVSTLESLGLLFARSFRWADSERCFREALEIRNRVGTLPTLSVMTSLAVALLMRGDREATRELLKGYLASHGEQREQRSRATAEVAAVIAACDSPLSRIAMFIVRFCRAIGIRLIVIPASAHPWLARIAAPSVTVEEDSPLPYEPEDESLKPFPSSMSRLVESASPAVGSEDGTPKICDSVVDILSTRRNATGAPRPSRIGRNDPCPCGSGKKYKRCCGRRRGDS